MIGLDLYFLWNVLISIIIVIIIFYFIVRKKFTLQKYEALIKKPVLLIKHPTWNSPMIDDKTFEKVNTFLLKHPKKEVCLLLHTNGGTVFDSLRIANIMLEHGKVNVIVPQKAMSGGTLISMVANKLICKPSTAFGDLNPQMQTLSFFKFYGEKGLRKHMGKKNMEEKIYLDFLADAKNELCRMLSRKNRKLAVALTSGNLSHSQIITPEKLKTLGVELMFLKSKYPDKLIGR